MSFDDLIAQNIAYPGTRYIGVYDRDGQYMGRIQTGPLTFPNAGEKLYSFGLLSDVHIAQYATAESDFIRALQFFEQTEDVDFVCIAGDLSWHGYADELTAYAELVSDHSPNTPVYAIPGNHDVRNGLAVTISDYTGHPFYYSFDHGDDVFIFVGCWLETPVNGEGRLFTTDELQWLEETLAANKDKRCFVFEHVFPWDGCGNALGLYTSRIWLGAEATAFENLMRQYSNAIFFHGHSHLKFELQALDAMANYDNIYGCHSVHVPSVACPRDADDDVTPEIVDREAGSQGYVVDVYEYGIHLRGRDFAKGEFLPIASYWLESEIMVTGAGVAAICGKIICGQAVCGLGGNWSDTIAICGTILCGQVVCGAGDLTVTTAICGTILCGQAVCGQEG